jgi:hypothetical protein
VVGPEFDFVDEVRWDQVRGAGFGGRTRPVLVKGAVTAWPAWERWSFERFADLRKPDGSEPHAEFYTGLLEQGATREIFTAPIGPYMRDLDRASRRPRRRDVGLLSDDRRARLGGGSGFRLDWSYLTTFAPDRVYLSQWPVLREFPELRSDFAIRRLWPGSRLTWEFAFVGPANTVTGLHHDDSNNWFCQVRGTKEVLLFGPAQTRHLSPGRKFDWGTTLSDTDITRLANRSRPSVAFDRARGLYARVEAGDALFIPKRWWHAVVAMEPSISLAVFGLTPAEVVIDGGISELKHLLHLLRLYRWGNCTCHKSR